MGATEVEIRLLGPVEVAAGEARWPVGPPQRQLVLAIFAAQVGRQVSVDTLVDRIWEDRPPPAARRAVQAHVTRLRQTLSGAGFGAALTGRSGGYLLDLEPLRVDLYRFRQVAAQARDDHRGGAERVALLESALRCWQGQPLSGLDGSWVDTTREVWRRERVDAMVAWAETAFAVHGAERVIAPVAALVAEEPLCEPLVAVQIRALTAAGRAAEALECYAGIRTRLAEQLGTDPARELQEAHLAVLRDGAGSRRAVSSPAGLEPQRAIWLRRQRIATSNVDEAKLRYLDEAVRQAVADSERRPPAALVPHVRDLRDHVDQLLGGRQHPPQRARLFTVATYLSGLLGALALDLSAFPTARGYAAEAFDLTDALGEPDVQAWARGVQSLIAYYAGDFHDALAYAQDGRRRAPRGQQSVRLTINGEARALARLGDRYGVEAAVDHALTLVEELPPQTDVSVSLATAPYCRARTAANAATAFLCVGAPEKVAGLVADALTVFDRAELRGPQALSRLDLATATLHGRGRDVERACHLAAEALAVTVDQRFWSVHQRANQFLAAARPWAGHARVRQVAALVAERDRRPPKPAGHLPSRP
ncbi:AfsR/SARP family transcriptional regulator [Virgisporangium aurantiacum]|uniref:OmpR/PhoB-type domain-containing protein n=1 Tax=Virgisporangium aurantiacum TaxID=175570 RepID=A0A8J3ZJ04_9ACTN|nr:AfsR/SARP family transcriptional regulator [Virgisporangium aurantiacum]GIJ62318.1 hypothetical protein Vau01_098340 [Virgisporangium aurantiacum]